MGSVILEEEKTEYELSLSLPCENTKRRRPPAAPGESPHQSRILPHSHLGFLVSRTMRNTFLLFQPSSLWYFVVVAQEYSIDLSIDRNATIKIFNLKPLEYFTDIVSFICSGFFLIPEPTLPSSLPFSPSLPRLSTLFLLNWWCTVSQFHNLFLKCFPAELMAPRSCHF